MTKLSARDQARPNSRLRSVLAVVGIPTGVAAAYFSFAAPPVYVSTGSLVVYKANRKVPGLVAMLSGSAGGGSLEGGYVLRDYLKSWTEFHKADATIDLAKAWSKGGFLFRYGGLWSLFRRNDVALWHYYQDHVQVSVSTNSGIVSIRVLGPTSSFASRLGRRVLDDAVAHIDAMNRQEEADYISTAVARRRSVRTRLDHDESALASYRSRIGIYDPKALYVSQLSFLNDLEEEKAKLEAQYETLTSATPNNPVGGNIRSAISVISTKITSANANVSKLSRDAARYATLVTAQANDESMLSQVSVAVQEAELNADKNKYYLDIISSMSNPETAELPHGFTDTFYIFLLSFVFWIFVR